MSEMTNNELKNDSIDSGY